MAVWAHFDPILDILKRQNPDVQHLNFLSDGPAAQCRQKRNFYMTDQGSCTKKAFRKQPRNSLRASNGKGASDRVKEALTRSADALVHHEKDIPNAQTLYQVLMESGTHVKLFYVSNKVVEVRVKKMQEALRRQ